ncbi:kinase A anchor protein [Mycena filopes]|nr:kinase A anchor protein [Mycena filopes]
MAGKAENQATGTNSVDAQAPSKRPPRKPQNSKKNLPRPTHFLSLPLGQHPELRDKINQFHKRLLTPGHADNAIEGLDQSILVDPRRLHLTIGVMTLSSTESQQSHAPDAPSGKTLSEAIALLHSLAPEINAITLEPVLVPLDKMGVLKTQRGQAGVLYLGPGDEISDNNLKVTRIFDLVGRKFRQEGFIQEAPRPAVLHCTLINASHRRPRRMPRTFSYQEIFAHAAHESQLASNLPSTETLSEVVSQSVLAPQDKAIKVDFGTWAVSEVQLCKMGSHGPENEYISLASVAVGRN